jgi:hypothetical protein
MNLNRNCNTLYSFCRERASSDDQKEFCNKLKERCDVVKCVITIDQSCEVHNPFCTACLMDPFRECSPAYATRAMCGGCCNVPENLDVWKRDIKDEYITTKDGYPPDSMLVWIDPQTILGQSADVN